MLEERNTLLSGCIGPNAQILLSTLPISNLCSSRVYVLAWSICRVGVSHVSLQVMPLIEPDDAHTPRTAECPASSYVLLFQSETFHKQKRYHWMVCGAQNPDELISWGHATTQELAAAAAQEEVNDLSSGLSRGGQVTSTTDTSFHRRTFHR
jgi:hypothetical protein